jgi:hypothetical protein
LATEWSTAYIANITELTTKSTVSKLVTVAKDPKVSLSYTGGVLK